MGGEARKDRRVDVQEISGWRNVLPRHQSLKMESKPILVKRRHQRLYRFYKGLSSFPTYKFMSPYDIRSNDFR
jgi:hypothetical protein